MRILLICEGNNEEVLLNLLLDSNNLSFTRDALIGQRVYPVRQISNPIIKTDLKHYGMPVKVYRVGDTQNDELVIPNDLRQIVSKKEIYKYCTKPELEILLIITENKINEYEKVKSTQTPKQFAKANIKFNGKKYDQSSIFFEEYYRNRIDDLVRSINEYKRIRKKHKKEELYLADLLK